MTLPIYSCSWSPDRPWCVDRQLNHLLIDVVVGKLGKPRADPFFRITQCLIARMVAEVTSYRAVWSSLPYLNWAMSPLRRVAQKNGSALLTGGETGTSSAKSHF